MKYKVIMNNGNEHYVDFDNENYKDYDGVDGGAQDFVKALCSTKYIETEEFIKVDKYKWRKRKILLSTRNISEVVLP
jgi:hypothetical protein